MASLLEKTRKLDKLLQSSEVVEYDGISRVLSNVLDANVYITDDKGKIYGYAFVDDFECSLMIDKVINQGEFPKKYVNWLMRIDETRANLRSKTGMCAYDEGKECKFHGKNTTIVPIYGVGNRIGTLIVAKYNGEFTDDDLLLAEYSATVVGMEMFRAIAEKKREETHKRAVVHTAMYRLSPSEKEAAVAIFTEFDPEEGQLIASKVADEARITRSVIVNVLRKLESAGIIHTDSMGMKGTRIRILNDKLFEGIQELRREV